MGYTEIGRRQVSIPKTSKRATGRHTEAFARYIRQVVVDRNVLQTGTDTYVLSFINPLNHSVLYTVQRELGTLKVKIIYALMA